MLCNIDVEDTEKILKLQEECKNDYYKFDKKSLIKAGKIDFVEENKQGTFYKHMKYNQKKKEISLYMS